MWIKTNKKWYYLLAISKKWKYKKLDGISNFILTEGDTVIFFAEVGATEFNSISIGQTLYASLIGDIVDTSDFITPFYECYMEGSDNVFIVPNNINFVFLITILMTQIFFRYY